MNEPTQTANLTGCAGFTDAERRGVMRLANRIRIELFRPEHKTGLDIEKKKIVLAWLDEALSVT
jgi:hypothetical protein